MFYFLRSNSYRSQLIAIKMLSKFFVYFTVPDGRDKRGRKSCENPKVYSFMVSEQEAWKHFTENLIPIYLSPKNTKSQSCKLWDPRSFYDLAICLPGIIPVIIMRHHYES